MKKSVTIYFPNGNSTWIEGLNNVESITFPNDSCLITFKDKMTYLYHKFPYILTITPKK